jgi:hypothetical protein
VGSGFHANKKNGFLYLDLPGFGIPSTNWIPDPTVWISDSMLWIPYFKA